MNRTTSKEKVKLYEYNAKHPLFGCPLAAHWQFGCAACLFPLLCGHPSQMVFVDDNLKTPINRPPRSTSYLFLYIAPLSISAICVSLYSTPSTTFALKMKKSKRHKWLHTNHHTPPHKQPSKTDPAQRRE